MYIYAVHANARRLDKLDAVYGDYISSQEHITHTNRFIEYKRRYYYFVCLVWRTWALVLV